MAILNRGFDQTNLQGSVGGVTYRRIGGVTIASQKVPMHVKAKQTLPLMFTRMRWVNLVALWGVINRTSWHPSFVRPNKRTSDFNMFMKANMAGARTYLTKGVAAAGGCVVAPVALTTPSILSGITVEYSSNVPETNLALGTLTLGNSTTLKVFSDAIQTNNAGWQMGDKLVILVVHQTTVNGVPTATAYAETVTLANDTEASTTLLKDVMDVTLLSVADGCLALAGPVTGGVAFIHTRLEGGETICSAADLVCNNATVLGDYQGTAAFNAAVESYGGFAPAQTLTPDVNIDLDVNA